METKMKRTALSILTIFAIALTACSALSNGASISSAQTGNKLSTATQLVVGTLKLEGTTQEITAEQARELSIYWYVYDELSRSDTAAQEEIDGLVDQIQESMTSEQLQAISDMQLTQQDVSNVTYELTTTSSSSQSGSKSTASSSGDMPAGVPADGGGMPSDTGGMDQMIGVGQTSVAQSAPSVGSSQEVSSALVAALIQSLEQKLA
jgi:hypothetical protein